ncbi:MAG: HNH endonuclease signature motif containing protein [Deltaproteobacteria bacterium]|nr:HNH endonuclease signature motif containing protein [Deltaproteobacteria bacterium]
MKICSVCAVDKEESEFYKMGAGHRARCKKCDSADSAAWRAANKEYDTARNAAWRLANPEQTAAAKKVWHQAHRSEANKRRRGWSDEKRAEVKVVAKKYRATNAEKIKVTERAWVANNREKVNAGNAAWKKANPAKIAAINARREADKIRATPAWADLEAIKDVYAEAAYFGMHVDHIVPLRGRTVCGLHVWDNLQLLTPKENIAKGNRHWPGMSG